MVIFEAVVRQEKWNALKSAFKAGMDGLKLLPITEAFLVQSKADPTLWRIVSIWYKQQDLEEAQSHGMLPGEIIFTVVGTNPTTSFFNVAEHSPGAPVEHKDGESKFKD